MYLVKCRKYHFQQQQHLDVLSQHETVHDFFTSEKLFTAAALYDTAVAIKG